MNQPARSRHGDIRPAVASDLATLAAIAVAAKAVWGYSAQQIARWHDDLIVTEGSLATRPVFVRDEDAGPVAFVQVDPTVEPWAVDALWVHPDHMRQGHGRALLLHACEHARNAGQRTLTVDADPNAVDFYRAFGAVVVGEVAAPIDGVPERVRPQLVLPTGTDAMDTLRTARLTLRPLTVAHADAMFALLQDPVLYRYLDYGPPPSLEHLRTVYARLERRTSPDGLERWLNWIVFDAHDEALGYVQATLDRDGRAWVAYLLHSAHWGRGLAVEATQAMIEHLDTAYGAARFLATVEVDHLRSIALLQRLGFTLADADERARHTLTATEGLFIR